VEDLQGLSSSLARKEVLSSYRRHLQILVMQEMETVKGSGNERNGNPIQESELERHAYVTANRD
jgi:hypothetical protein